MLAVHTYKASDHSRALYDFLAKLQAEDFENGLIFLNEDDADLVAMAQERNLIFQSGYGLNDNEDVIVRGEVVACDPFLRFRWWLQDEVDGDSEKMTVATHLIGSYNIYNMLAAITIGIHFDVDIDDINAALEEYMPRNNRSQLTETPHNHLIIDAYNANPSSMAAALRNFRDMAVSPKMAILGDMRELGETSQQEHQRAVDMMKEYGLEEVWLVGEEFAKTQCDYRKFPDVEAVKTAIEAQRPEGFYILIKGSNSVKLYQLPKLL